MGVAGIAVTVPSGVAVATCGEGSARSGPGGRGVDHGGQVSQPQRPGPRDRGAEVHRRGGRPRRPGPVRRGPASRQGGGQARRPQGRYRGAQLRELVRSRPQRLGGMPAQPVDERHDGRAPRVARLDGRAAPGLSSASSARPIRDSHGQPPTSASSMSASRSVAGSSTSFPASRPTTRPRRPRARRRRCRRPGGLPPRGAAPRPRPGRRRAARRPRRPAVPRRRAGPTPRGQEGARVALGRRADRRRPGAGHRVRVRQPQRRGARLLQTAGRELAVFRGGVGEPERRHRLGQGALRREPPRPREQQPRVAGDQTVRQHALQWPQRTGDDLGAAPV